MDKWIYKIFQWNGLYWAGIKLGDNFSLFLIKALNLETPNGPNARLLQVLRSYTIQPLAVVRQQPADVQYGERPAGQVPNPSQREMAARQ
jgi:hypothetical protein